MRRPERSLLKFNIPAAALLALILGLVSPNNLRLWDLLNRSFTSPPNPRVVVVGIDDATLSDYGRLNEWNRSLYARAIATLRLAGAKVIALDLLLDAPAAGDSVLASTLTPQVVFASSAQSPGGARAWNATYGVASLNVEGGKVGRFQSAYQDTSGRMWPSLSAQVARGLGSGVSFSTQPQVLRYPANPPTDVVSFRDLLAGATRFSTFQDKAVLIGVTASGVPGSALPDSQFDLVPGVLLQARAVSSLLGPPLRALPLWLTALLCAAVAALAAALRGLWGFGLALLTLGLSAPLFLGGILFPGVAVSVSAIIGVAFVAFERWWQLRHLSSQDPLTGLGNRLAFTRAVELRWNQRAQRFIGLVLVDLSNFRHVNEKYGRAAGDDLLREVAQALQSSSSKRDLIFRWGADEFAVMVESANLSELQRLVSQIESTLGKLRYNDVLISASIGQALSTPQMRQPSELVEQASRDRYRMKFKSAER